MNKTKILKELNDCISIMDKKVTEGSVNTQIELFTSMIKTNYSVDEDFNSTVSKVKQVSDYNMRKKMLKDLFRKYVR